MLWSGRVAHKVTFFCDQRFFRVGPYCAAVVKLPQQHTRTLSLLPRSVFSCVLVWQLHCSFIPGVHLYVALCHHLLKVLSETCGYKTLSYEYNCGVMNNVYINYPVKVNVQLHWCESQKHQLCQIETWRAGNFATSSDFRKFAFVLSGKRARGKLQVPSALLK